MGFVIQGNAHIRWSGERDDEGHRHYTVVHRLRADPVGTGFENYGPADAILNTSGIPQPGDAWSFDNDSDPDAWCTNRAKMTPVTADEPGIFFDLEQTFTTKPPESQTQQCQDVTITNPLAEPPKISGSFVNYNEEATHDRFGFFIQNSAHEQMRGPQVEFSKNRPRIIIEQNTASPTLAYILPSQMQNTVNMYTLWGLPPRTILLAEASWEKKYYGACSVYYNRKLTFDIDYETFDRQLLDEGSKVLNGHWNPSTGHWVLDLVGGEAPDPYNPSHFIRFKDKKGENTKVILDGFGRPSGVCVDEISGFDSPNLNPPSPQYYLCYHGGEAGHPPTDENRWMLIGATPPVAAAHSSTVRYVRGNVVTSGGNTYVAEATNTGDTPPSDNWRILSGALANKGLFDETVTYADGDYVKYPTLVTGTGSLTCDPTVEGIIYLEYYLESNFLALGIPTSF